MASLHANAIAKVLTALLLPGLCALGCGDEKIVAVDGSPTDTAADTTAPDGADGIDPNPTGRELIVLHDSSQPLQVRVANNQTLRVKLVDYGLGGPAPDATVSFAIRPKDPAVQGDASLSSLNAFTDQAGIASVTFRANTAADLSYIIDVSAADADPVSFEIFVANAPRGSLRVELRYEGPIAVKNVHVRLVPGQYTCGQFNPVNPTTDIVGEKTLLGIGAADIVWPNLPEGQRFTVFATADSPRDHLAAAGCLDGVVIVPNQENKVTLTLYLLTLNPTGYYDNTTVFDFTGAIPGQLGDLVDEISLLFSSPGTFLINQIKRLAAMYVGEFITDTIFGLFEDAVADVIDDWMFNRSPDWLQDILTVGQDLFQIVNNLELLATLRITKLTNDYYVQGMLYWNGVALYWRVGCPRPGEANYDPQCGRNEFSLAAFANTQFPMDIIEGRFTASIQDFDQLDIDNHVIKINYGKLILFALNELVLPALTGEHNLTDAVLSFIDCAAIADGIYFSALGTIGISESDIEGFCTSAIEVITRPVTAILGALAVDSQMRMSGHAVMVDTNDDLSVDRFDNGSFLGNFESDGQLGNPFTGVWSATRITQP
jgi:hypothetical protein